MPTAPSNRRADLEGRLRTALIERDQALLELAKERELTNAMRLERRSPDEKEPRPYPASAGLGPTPLRYRVADKANDRLKAVLGPVQKSARWLAELLIKR